MFDHDKIFIEDEIINKYFQTKWNSSRIKDAIENSYII